MRHSGRSTGCGDPRQLCFERDAGLSEVPPLLSEKIVRLRDPEIGYFCVAKSLSTSLEGTIL